MNGMQDYETMERWLGSKGSVDSLDTELAGLHEEEFWNWLICNYKRFVADCKSYDISSTLQMSNSGVLLSTIQETSTFDLDCSKFEPGVYFLSVQSDTEQKVKQFIKK